MSSLIVAYTIIENWIADSAMVIVKTIFALLLIGIVTALVVLTVEVASADSSDFTTGTVIPSPMHSFSVAYVSVPEESITYNSTLDICEYWAVTPLGDWYYGYILDPVVTYELTFWAGKTVVVGCTARD